jgi:phenylpyruvate tautomerase PptA (4-oxalocrotonate tautomerase family)
MPYVRLASLPLAEETKRRLADELTATVLDILPDQKPEWTTVHFTPFAPQDFAVAGRLVADGAIPDTHLEISIGQDVDESKWIALRNRLTDVVVEELGIDEPERWHVNVKLNRYDPHNFAVAGNAADELTTRPPVPAPRRRGRRRRRLMLLLWASVAYGSYRWFASRVATDATVDVAPPLEEPAEEAAAAHPS